MTEIMKELYQLTSDIQKEFSKIQECFYDLENNMKELIQLENTGQFKNKEKFKKAKDKVELQDTPKLLGKKIKLKHKKESPIYYSKVSQVRCISPETGRKCRGYKIQFYVFKKYIYIGPYKNRHFAQQLKIDISNCLNDIINSNKTEFLMSFLIGIKDNLSKQFSVLQCIDKDGD